ncbi:hypothetical protein LEP1GSC060_1391 [Leptospira weilii serovar Ranarum str. ICFT]|uniref:Uncharacterized protein n=1 Tax=Leptospira weilii serovar Ranarum str. ICFT TaxID=1218598 RepID=N1WLY9_9LEPT|nr:hypothetical protein LEP1GSC060_1391 [Leptospira weilii serovar Ranarum str. ICFT]
MGNVWRIYKLVFKTTLSLSANRPILSEWPQISAIVLRQALTRICIKIPFQNVMRHFWKRFKKSPFGGKFENPRILGPKRSNNGVET